MLRVLLAQPRLNGAQGLYTQELKEKMLAVTNKDAKLVDAVAASRKGRARRNGASSTSSSA